MPSGLGLVAAALLSVTAGGCSFLFVNGPPPDHKTSNFFGCTSSNTIPFVDIAFAAGSVLEAVEGGAGAQSQNYNTTTASRTGEAVTFGVTAAVLAASAAYGFSKTSQCREALADLVRRAPPPTLVPALAPPVHYDPWVARPAQTPAGALPDVPPPGPAPPPAPDAPEGPTVTVPPPPPAPPGAPPSPWEPKPAQ